MMKQHGGVGSNPFDYGVVLSHAVSPILFLYESS